MLIEYKDSFKKDLEKISDKLILNKVASIIDIIKESNRLYNISNIKKIKGFKDYYRIRIKNYRLGMKINPNLITLIRILPRKDVYKYFPK